MTTLSRFTARVPRPLHDRLQSEADQRGLSLTALVTTLLAQAAEIQEPQSPAPPVPARGSLPGSASADAGGPTARAAPAATAERAG